MPNILPRILYILAALAWFLLLRPNPVTIVMAGCFACLTLPSYRRMRCVTRRWRKHLRLRHPGRPGQFIASCFHRLPLYGYILLVVSAVVIPISTLVLLVSPQVAGGLARLRELQANNFQLPPEWVMRVQELRHSLAAYPKVDKMVSEFLSNLDALLADTMGLLINRSVDVLGGTMTVLWTLFLFVTLTVIFAAYAGKINLVTARICHIPATMLRRFVLAVRRALQGVMLGIVLVAIAQGFLCGLGFAVAGIKQPAFWGLLATVVAPIPFVGTAIVWVPLCISLWFSGDTMPAVGLALWGSLAVTSVDNILRPLFLQQGIKAPFFVLIVAILCGLGSFGPMGLIIGPVLLAIAMQAVEEAHQTYHHTA
ncbi:AI-2E family transporter [uncultured Desulfovibrio sp.]|uniref:AI-2E family transporter n=1 Tax=uncultured Desulfovibrio sp. TaxID=167968 RepID=UPI00261AF554|nr:AI-2E family transporter [uncultured Desulfovibrio sp.]